MTKKVIQTALLIALFATPIVTTTTVFAEDFDTKIQEQDKKINELKNESQNTKTDLEKITTNVTQNEEKSKQILVDMQATQNKMDTLQQENQELTVKIDQREDQLEKQARVVQVNGDTQNYIDFVLEAKSMSDIIGRVDVVAQMVSANRAMVKQQADDKAQVVKQEKEVAKKSDEQKVLAADLAKTQEKLQTQKLEKESIVAQIAADTATAEGDKNKFLAQKAAAEKEAEDLRIAKVAADKKASEDAEAARVVQLANAKAAEAAKNTTVAAAPPAENPQGGGTPPVSTGAYGRPTNAPVSSSYGPRSGYDANGFHKGIDFGGAVGTPIYASMSGRVVIAQYDGMPVSGYGIATVIQHDNGTWTLYAHQSSQSVKVGDVVTKGQQIGAIGATGQVDGAHLHFEIRTAQDGGMGNVVDPAPLLGL
ncbi:MAG: peptidoglycan DD-metalloendopeptidase family protein [Carnobacterium sp.]|uniref:Peptidase M23 family protein n=1 Tax=Carnobacterium maltaromaticum LMA28 TaxID=1234679 RepID=K8E1R6_CARML|nr:M23 family metallopeptidase [Carnobacterium maltaromaticum]AOA03672.1 secreted cell wall DL-endopeptidase [Carnobacterium maltaromaticum]KRN61935.1 secreted cell wall DL-endopeptidase [Carnobacterium maltaromaticum DSM 20342]MCI1819490.1 peptidoglycan DD-metalloendopeptidase family protein [Carnobacterium maltaromaticum]CCO09725.2 peptidase M23 family protein [Carnobacterium maltaromaticum LMA28]